eukprot:3203899-Rhodomonas_salina.4
MGGWHLAGAGWSGTKEQPPAANSTQTAPSSPGARLGLSDAVSEPNLGAAGVQTRRCGCGGQRTGVDAVGTSEWRQGKCLR